MNTESTNYTEIEMRIVELLGRGDQQAISLAYDHYSHALFGIVRRIIHSEELAQEILHNVYIKVWKNSDKYDRSKGRLFTWLANIARNSAIDATRSAAYKRVQKTDILDPAVYNSKTNSEQLNIKDSGLRKVINQLDEKYRVLIDLAYYQGYTQSEIVEELGIPLGTVKTRLRTALKELREVLKPEMLSYIIFIVVILKLVGLL